MQQRLQQARVALEHACDAIDRPIHVMEVCGTHTVAIFRHGIRSILPPGIKLLSGPGCPVCVTDQSYIDAALSLAERDDIILATYGDMLRVPGERESLETCQGVAEVRVVLSSDDALQLARQYPDKTVVFLAVGFETTTPATAVVVQDAARLGLENFCVMCSHKTVIPAIEALLSQKNDRIDAFLCPGHVSVIIGAEAYRPVVEDFGRPCVVAGFEAIQILEGLAAIAQDLVAGKPQLRNQYGAVVTPDGNPAARAIIDEYFEACDGIWRGIGVIPGSGLKLRDKYQQFDGFARFGLSETVSDKAARGCRCGEVLCGLIDPSDCGLFGKACNPQHPIGPCMVSSEGACAAWFKYGRHGHE